MNEKQREYQRKYYGNLPSEAKAKRSAAAKISRDAKVLNTMRALRRYKMASCCVDCGEPDPIVLEFDHREGETKSFGIAKATSKAKDLSVILAEVDKCDVVCSNCHQRRTHKRRWLMYGDQVPTARLHEFIADPLAERTAGA
jgi:hypothetical protein